MANRVDTERSMLKARIWFERGHLVPAEIRIRQILEHEPGHAGAYDLLGDICFSLGLKEQAIAAYEHALGAGAESSHISDKLEKARHLPSPSPSPSLSPGDERQSRYLLIKAWGFGFWSDVAHTLACLLLAEITGRTPVVHWGRNSLFNDSEKDDAFSLYFEPVSDVTIDDVAAISPFSVFPDKWSAHNLRDEENAKWEGSGSRLGGILYLNRPETLVVTDFNIAVVNLLPWLPSEHPMHGKPLDDVYCYLGQTYLKPQASIMDEVRSFFDTHLAGRSAVAVHARGSDKQLEVSKIAVHNQRLFDLIEEEPADSPLFLMTDDTRCLALFRDRYGDRVVTTAATRTANDKGIHLHDGTDRVRLGRDIMVDSYLALECQTFIGNGHSNVSAMIAVLKRWPEGHCHLISKSGLWTLVDGAYWVVETTLNVGKVFGTDINLDSDRAILALERLDTFARPEIGPIDYRDPNELDRIIDGVRHALDINFPFAAALRLQVLVLLHFDAMTAQQPHALHDQTLNDQTLHDQASHYLDMLLCLARLRAFTQNADIDVNNQTAILNGLVRPDCDIALRERLNNAISVFNDNNLVQCEAELRKLLHELLPELAAPAAKDVRAALIAMSQNFQDPSLEDIFKQIDAAVDDQAG